MPYIRQLSSHRPARKSVLPPSIVNRATKTVPRKETRQSPVSRPLVGQNPRVPQRINEIIVQVRGVRATTSNIQPEPPQQSQGNTRIPRYLINSIPKRAFQATCKELAYKYMPGCRFAKEALEALQLAVEDYMIGFFEDSALCMRHAKRKTLMIKDIQLVCALRKISYEPL